MRRLLALAFVAAATIALSGQSVTSQRLLQPLASEWPS
jgi:hypothetical protein